MQWTKWDRGEQSQRKLDNNHLKSEEFLIIIFFTKEAIDKNYIIFAEVWLEIKSF